MDTTSLFNNAVKAVKSNAPEILTALGVSGVVSTSYLAVKAGMKSMNPKYDITYVSGEPSKRKRLVDKAKLTWKLYLPPVASGAVTVACVLAAHKSSANRTTAAVTAFKLTESAFNEYKEEAAKEIGKVKEQRMRDDIVQNKVNANPPSTEVMVLGDGEVLCFDIRSVRYFRSTHENLKRAENEINYQINHERYVSLSEFYALIGLPITKESVSNGWSLDQGLMELDITATISDDNKPCLAIDYNYCRPLHDDPVCLGDR